MKYFYYVRSDVEQKWFVAVVGAAGDVFATPADKPDLQNVRRGQDRAPVPKLKIALYTDRRRQHGSDHGHPI